MKRSSFRVDLRLPAAVLHARGLSLGHLENLSHGGLFVRIEEDASVGSEVQVKLQAGGGSLALDGTVVRAEGVDGSDGLGIHPVGLGVRFESLAESQRDWIRRRVDGQLVRTVFGAGESCEEMERALDEIARYEIMDQIGRGGSAQVYKARDRIVDDLTALKVFKPELSRDEEYLERVHREIRMARRIKSDRVAGIFDFGQIGRRRFIAMEYVPGTSLHDRIAARGPMEEDEGIRMLVALLDGLSAAHRKGIVHRDLKPANVMVTPDGGPVLVDLGLARRPEDPGLTHTSMIVGTPSFMAPEQIEGRVLDPRTDLYSFGCLAFFVFDGDPPFHSTTTVNVAYKQVHVTPPRLRSRRPHVSVELDALIARCLSKTPDERYQSAEDLAEGLQRILERSREPTEELEALPVWNAVSSTELAELVDSTVPMIELRSSRVPGDYAVVEQALLAGARGVVLELRKPDYRELEIIQTLRAFPQTEQTPIVLLSRDPTIQGLPGFDARTAVVTPPFTRARLLKGLRELGIGPREDPAGY